MPLTSLLAQAYSALLPSVAKITLGNKPAGLPNYVIFFSAASPQQQAHIHIAKGDSFDDAWHDGVQYFSTLAAQDDVAFDWLRVDVVNDVHSMSWAALCDLFKRTKRNYFRFGLAFDADFSVALLEQELAANALLYNGKIGVSTPNNVNFKHYSKRRFGRELQWPEQAEATVWRFKTRAVFTDGQQTQLIESTGSHRGYRQLPEWGAATVVDIIGRSSSYLAKQVKPSGEYHYGWFPCFDRAIPTYNALRHASSTYALLEGWELTKDKQHEAAIRRALQFLTDDLIKTVILPDGQEAAFLVDLKDEIKLGGNAVCLLAFSKYTELTGDRHYLALAEKLAVGILYMQDPHKGSFTHVLNYPDLSVKAAHRIIYYDGEAAFGLMRLYGITRDDRWLQAVVHAFDYFIEAKHWQAHDHWLSYCVNELTLYKPDDRYYQFGLDNVRDYLDFVTHRITTFPTLLELMMAAQRMIVRIQEEPEKQYLLQGFPLDKFYLALETRARYLLNGFFWPELAMFFKNPGRILDGFFIRHHSFRVRIDDVEHYLSGYVAYWKYLQQGGAPAFSAIEIAKKPDSFVRKADPFSVGFLMYPESPKGFVEVRKLAEKAVKQGLTVFYASYRTAYMDNGKMNGYAFRAGRWQKAQFEIPAIIDNAPARKRSEEALFDQLAAVAFLTCHKLGGKQKTEQILAASATSKEWLIPSVNLSMEALDKMLDKDAKVIVKPYRSNRGRNVFLLEKIADGIVLARTNETVIRMDRVQLEDFVAQRSHGNWMVQQYIAATTPDGRAYDIRVPIFRAAGGEWQVAQSYARVGAGEITSNLAAGGSNHEAKHFLAEFYDEKTADALVSTLERAARQIAETLQQNYAFIIDALGCDFGIVDGRAYLFEVNAYPGLKGCLESATDLKAAYYVALSKAWRSAGLTAGSNDLQQYDWFALLQQKNEPLVQTAMPKIQATTEANRLLLQQVMEKGENDYSHSPLLKPGIGNPVYRLIGNEARRRGYQSRLVSNTHLEVRKDEELLAIFSPNSPNLSFATGKTTQNKESTRKLLLAADLPTPVGKAFRQKENALAYFQDKTEPQVIKPLLGSGGKGVTAGVTTLEQFEKAWDRASAGRKRSVVVEDFAVGDEIRLIVLGGETVAAVCRIPAYVIGDGISTIAQLVEAKNAEKKTNPLMRRYPISQFDYLETVLQQGLDFVPASGEFVQLSSVSNVALGGEAVSLIDVLHPSFFELARRTFDAFPGATQIGLDVMAKDFAADAFADNAMIIEVNSDPAVGTPRYATYGPAATTISAKLLDFAENQYANLQKTKPTAPARLLPAPLYKPVQGAKPFPRSYRLQGRLLRDAALQRGLAIEALSADITLVSDGDSRKLFCFGISDATLRSARRASNDKAWTKRLLHAAGVATPEGNVFAQTEADKAWAFAVESGLPVVIKPLVGSGGIGVFTDISTTTDFDIAWQSAIDAGATKIIVEPYIVGKDYRLFVVQNALVAAARRDPAYVIGDGVSTIDGLIAQKNVIRKRNPHHGAKPIVLTELMLRNLRQVGLTQLSVLEQGQRLELHTVANIGRGGESVDVTETVHPAWAEIAVRARAAVFDAYHAGVDLIAEDISRAPDAQQWAIIEVNTNPDFGANHFPMHGAGRDVAGVLLEALFARNAEPIQEQVIAEA